MDKDKFSTKEKEIKYELPWLVGHEALLVLVPKEDAEGSYEARKLALLKLEVISGKTALYNYYVGGIFSGLLSDICGEKAVIPFYNKEMREEVRKVIGGLALDQIRELIQKEKKVNIFASEIKKIVPEFEKYNDADLLDALRLELKDLDIDMSFVLIPSDHKIGDIFYIFKASAPMYENIMGGYFVRTHRYMSVELGYEDDAMNINECLYHEVIERNKEKVIDIYKGPIDITPNIIGKKWVVLVDIY